MIVHTLSLNLPTHIYERHDEKTKARINELVRKIEHESLGILERSELESELLSYFDLKPRTLPEDRLERKKRKRKERREKKKAAALAAKASQHGTEA